MSYEANAAYWQAQANRCKQFADEGACLARISRNVPVTIVPGFGLGQVGSSLSTLAPGGTEIRALQTALIHVGALTIRTADGLISSTSSPTLAAIRAWATSNGLSSTGTARTSNSGLVIPTSLLNRILALTTTTEAAPASSDVPLAPAASAVLPGFTAEPSWRRWAPWALGGSVAVAATWMVMRRRRGVAKNRRRRR